MKKLVLILFAAISLGALAADTTIKGTLVDMACAREDGSKPGFGAKHSKDCLEMPDCVKSGYGLMTADKKVIKFDKAGNDQAKKFIAEMKKAKDIQVEVTGAVTGDTMTVSKIVLQ
jgi:hypothetical protein